VSSQEKNVIKQIIDSLGLGLKGSFVQNFAIAFSGNAFAQVLGFIFTPFVARIYGPETYGLFALFVAVVNNISPVTTLQYPSGYVMARSEGEFISLVRITFSVLVLFTLSTAVLTYFFSHEFIGYFGSTKLQGILYLIPVSVFFMGFDYHQMGSNLKAKEFKRAAVAKLFSVIISRIFTLIYGLFVGAFPVGIILGNLIQYIVNSAALFSKKTFTSFREIFDTKLAGDFKGAWNNFKSYPLYVTPGVLISGLSLQLPVYMFSGFFTLTAVGHFTLANSVVSAPLSILLNSLNVVFLQKASETQLNSPELLPGIVRKLYRRITYFSILPIVVFALISKVLFSIVFGSEWEQAGVYAAFLALSALFCANGPVSIIYRVLDRQRLDFQLNIIFLVLKTLGLLPGILLQNLFVSVIGYCFVSWLCSATSLMIIFKQISLDRKIILKDAILGIILFLLILYFYI
jgi:O-antigen/teichoic acid export membrane protein